MGKTALSIAGSLALTTVLAAQSAPSTDSVKTELRALIILQVEGRQKLTLTSDAGNTFSLPAGGGQFTFAKNAAGLMTYELVRANGTVVKGTRTQ